MLKRLAGLDPIYGLLLTFGIALIVQGLFQNAYGASGQPYPMPDHLRGGFNLGFMYLPVYRGWVIGFRWSSAFRPGSPSRRQGSAPISARRRKIPN